MSVRAMAVVGLLLVVASVTFVSAIPDVSRVVPFQGKLSRPDGTPYSGTYSMTFQIWDAASGGTKLWEETQPAVSVRTGFFQVQLGPVNIPFDRDYWLQVVVAGETLGPRPRITAAPYALYANRAGSAVTAETASFAPRAGSADSLGNGTVTISGGNVNVAGSLSLAGQLVTSVGGTSAFFGNFGNPNGAIYGFSTPNVNQLVIEVDSGEVGIGTADPQYKLHVEGTAGVTSDLTVGGSVGIGTPGPQYKLHVIGTAGVTSNLNVGGSISTAGDLQAGGSANIAGLIRGATYGYGGAYSGSPEFCYVVNAFTNGCTCPSGFAAQNVYDTLWICYR